jgi:hypothetical protein
LSEDKVSSDIIELSAKDPRAWTFHVRHDCLRESVNHSLINDLRARAATDARALWAMNFSHVFPRSGLSGEQSSDCGGFGPECAPLCEFQLLWFVESRELLSRFADESRRLNYKAIYGLSQPNTECHRFESNHTIFPTPSSLLLSTDARQS